MNENKRKLKVYSKYNLKRGRNPVINPEIRLSGNWLANMGFKNGSTVIVRPVGFGIMILSNETETVDLPTIHL